MTIRSMPYTEQGRQRHDEVFGRERNELTLTREQPPPWNEPILVARYKSCEAHLAEFGEELNIQFIHSHNKGNGDAQGLVKALLKHCKAKGLVLASSTIISPDWEHIAKKYKLIIYGEL